MHKIQTLTQQLLAWPAFDPGSDQRCEMPLLADSPIRHVQELPARQGKFADWPAWTAPELVGALAANGISQPWQHQVDAANHAWAGRDVIIATGPASGKSLVYQLPVLSALCADSRATALYLSPTKALGVDQVRTVSELELTGIRPAGLDGDTLANEREWIREHARFIFTNPDMLHRTILPRHQRWRSFLGGLQYVVIDECHSYRGIFGSHVAGILRRLQRLSARYGAQPVFIAASATVAQPGEFASELIGRPIADVTHADSPRSPMTFALWEPGFSQLTGEHGAPVRHSAVTETAHLLADLVATDVQTLAFVRSRQAAESVASHARNFLADSAPDSVDSVAAYRGGYLAEERRAVEKAFANGKIRGLASTNALELGVDIAGLDAVLLCGYPGTLASLWQQAGRAGRKGQPALVIFVARDDPLDTYLVHHPEAIFGRPVENVVIDPGNPHVLGPQLCCAAYEAPLTESDVELFGGAAVAELLPALVEEKLLRRRPSGWHWTSRQRPVADIRAETGQVRVVDGATGQLLGEVNASNACSVVHPGAIYVHQGQSYVVDELLLDEHLSLVHPETPDWSTHPRSTTDVSILREQESQKLDAVALHYGEVEVSNHVVSFFRRDRATHKVIDETPLDLPIQRLRTHAVWYTVDDSALAEAGLENKAVAGSLHAAEHAAIGLLPLFASCDRSDIGGVSIACHPDTGQPTVFIYDGHPGGSGFSYRGFRDIAQWLSATRQAIYSCGCADGCPSCVQSPKCGNRNQPLNKAGAVTVLDLVLTALSE